MSTRLLFLQKDKGTQEITLEKKFINVGTEATHDIVVESSKRGLLFSLILGEDAVSLVPGDFDLRLNDKSLKSGGQIKNLDQIAWKDGKATFVQSSASSENSTNNLSSAAVHVLEKMAQNLPNPGSFRWNLNYLLDFILESSGAENVSLLWESPSNSAWELLAFRSGLEKSEVPNSKSLISQTVLKQALDQQKTVVAESLIGHPWAHAQSLVHSKIFSVACIPLKLEDQTVGAIFLSTHSPGKSIKKETLEELKSLTLIATLLVVTQNQLQKILPQVRQQKTSITQLIGQSLKMRELKARVEKLAPTPLSLLLLGETGSGKEVLAKMLHEQSERSQESFVAVNCAAIPESLLESTLFGHTKGAFTGAIRNQIGKFQAANRGTLFLDEIGDLPLSLQSKLLRVLQDKMIEPVGATISQLVDVRIIAATHVDLEKAVASGKFRQDLYFRLKGAVITLPPLRDRKDDIPFLADYFLGKTNTQKSLSPSALEKLQSYNWPGNVRELEQTLVRSAFLSSQMILNAEDIELETNSSANVQKIESELFQGSLKNVQKSFTTHYILKVLEQNLGNRSKTALNLGVSERTLYRLLESDAPDSLS